MTWLFLLFLQQIISQSHFDPAEILGADSPADKRTARRWLFRRCFSLSCQNLVPIPDEILMIAMIAQ